MIRTILLCILFVMVLTNTVINNLTHTNTIKTLRVINEKIDQITLIVSGEYEPIDLTYIPRLIKKEGLKEKE